MRFIVVEQHNNTLELDSYTFSPLHKVLLAVFFWFQNYDVALWCKNAKQESKGRGQNSKNMYGHCVFSRCAHINWNESDPHCKEN